MSVSPDIYDSVTDKLPLNGKSQHATTAKGYSYVFLNRGEVGTRGLTLHPLLAGGSELFYAPVAKGGVSGDHSVGGDVGDLRRIGVRNGNVLKHSIRVKKTDVSTEPLEVPMTTLASLIASSEVPGLVL